METRAGFACEPAQGWGAGACAWAEGEVMGFKESITGAFSKATEFTKSAGNKLKEEAKKAIEVNRIEKEIRGHKENFLRTFRPDQLKKLARENAVSEYKKVTRRNKQGKIYIKQIKKDFEDYVSVLKSHLSSPTIINFAERNKLKETLQFKTTYEKLMEKRAQIKQGVLADPPSEPKPSTDTRLETLIEALRNYNAVEAIRDEAELKLSVAQYLRGKFPEPRIQTEIPIGPREIVDILFDDNIGIEVKIAKNNTVLRNLIGQIEEYTPKLEELVIFLYNAGANVDVDYYLNRYAEKGANTVVCRGEWRRRKKQILVYKGI